MNLIQHNRGICCFMPCTQSQNTLSFLATNFDTSNMGSNGTKPLQGGVNLKILPNGPKLTKEVNGKKL